MACGCSDTFQISSCAPYASLSDVQSAFNSLGQCCKGVIPDGLDPVQSPVDALVLGFPDGLGECACDLLMVTSLAESKVWGSVNNGESWFPILDEGRCSSTIPNNVNPITNPSLATASAFPNGLPLACEAFYLSNDNGTFLSTDRGLSYARITEVERETASLRLTRETSLTNTTLNQYVPWQIADMDSRGMWDPSFPERINVLVSGIYLITTTIRFIGNGASRRTITLVINSTPSTHEIITQDVSSQVSFNLTTIRYLSVGDYFGINVAASGNPTGGGIGADCSVAAELLRLV